MGCQCEQRETIQTGHRSNSPGHFQNKAPCIFQIRTEKNEPTAQAGKSSPIPSNLNSQLELLKSSTAGQLVTLQLYMHFSDESELGYGWCLAAKPSLSSTTLGSSKNWNLHSAVPAQEFADCSRLKKIHRSGIRQCVYMHACVSRFQLYVFFFVHQSVRVCKIFVAIKSFIEAALQMRANNVAHICDVCLLPWNAEKNQKQKATKQHILH